MRQKLEAAANVAVIVIAVAVCVVFVRWYLGKRQPRFQGIKPGDRLHSDLIGWGKHDRTLILAMRVGCAFCERSMPFYKRLADMERDGAIHVHIVAALPDDASAARAFLNAQGLTSIDFVPGIPLNRLDLAGTPTVILVDKDGLVLNVWLGLLSKRGEDSLITSIGGNRASLTRSSGAARALWCRAPNDRGFSRRRLC